MTTPFPKDSGLRVKPQQELSDLDRLKQMVGGKLSAPKEASSEAMDSALDKFTDSDGAWFKKG